jgi:acyl-CoA synthetase (AMP-forming)/AMP-acid ligase II
MMLSATMKAKKLNYILNNSCARILITHPSKAKAVKDAVTDIHELTHIVWCTGKEQAEKIKLTTNNEQLTTNISFHEMLSIPCTLNLAPYSSPVDLDLATIIYTSGSTGEPKGVMAAHCNVMAAARSISTYLENVADDIIISALPLSFDYGLYQVLMVALFGGTVVLEKSFVFPYKVLERLVQEKATGLPLVPTMAAILLQLEDLSKFNFSSLRYISNTAAALPVSHIKKLRGRFPHTRIYSMYGLTECKRVSYLPPEEIDRRPDSVGIAMPNEEVFIVDESGNEVGPETVGELVIRGGNVMQGYWNDPETTEQVYRPGRHAGEQLLFSGDLFKKDKDGFLYFVARKDDLIKTKGERVSPKEIENVVCEMEGVAEASVIGVPDEVLGQAIKLFVVRRNSKKINRKDINKFCTLNLEPFMIPKYVEFVDNLPKSSGGKVDKKQLKKNQK